MSQSQPGVQARSRAACYRIARRRWRLVVGLLWAMVLATYGSGTALGYFLSSAQDGAECLTVVGDEPSEGEGMVEPEEGDSVAASAEEQSGEAAQTVSYILRERDTLYDALGKFGVPAALVREWEQVAQPLYPLSRVHAGQSFDLAYAEPDQFLGLTFHLSPQRRLVIKKEGDGWRADLEEVETPAEPPAEQPKLVAVSFHYENGIPIIDDLPQGPVAADSKPHAFVTPAPGRSLTLSTGEQVYTGAISTSFYESARQAGLSAGLIADLIEIFYTEVDFRRDFRAGDRFEALTAAPPTGRGEPRVLAARIEAGRQTHWAFSFKDGKRPAGYYDEKGNALGRFSLQSPIRAPHLSSRYTYHRFHPILHYFRPHLAVDFSAPSGTPIHAPAAGVIEYAGWKGDWGRYLSLRHNSTYTTTYGHLSGFAPGIHRGARVKQGQIIGYVGSTGLSTGSHLCYRVLKNGKSINPLQFKGSAGPPAANLKDFRAAKTSLQAKLASISPAAAAARVAQGAGD